MPPQSVLFLESFSPYHFRLTCTPCGTCKYRCATITGARYWHRRIPLFADGDSKPCPQCNVIFLDKRKTTISVPWYWYRGFPFIRKIWSSIFKDTIQSVKHAHPVWNYFYKSIIYKLQQCSVRLLSLNENRVIYNPKIYIFINMYPSINKTIQAMFSWSDKIFEAIIATSYQQHESLEKLREKQH